MSTSISSSCPQCDTNDEHEDDCPRVNTVGQIGPPWTDGPWANWCTIRNGYGEICMRPEGHTDTCPGDWKGPT